MDGEPKRVTPLVWEPKRVSLRRIMGTQTGNNPLELWEPKRLSLRGIMGAQTGTPPWNYGGPNGQPPLEL